MINQRQSSSYEKISKKLRILLHFLKEEISDSNYRLINTKRCILYTKLRLYIKQDQKKKQHLIDIIKQSIDKGIQQKSLSQLMVNKKLLQGLAFSEFTDEQVLSSLDMEINNYIFDQQEDPFTFYNTKLYQIIINNKSLFSNRKQLITSNQNITLHFDHNNYSSNPNNSSSIPNNDSPIENKDNSNKNNEIQTKNNNQEIAISSEDVRLEELFTYIFPKKQDIFNQLTELEHIVFQMSTIAMKQYKSKLKCTVYGSYMMGFQLSQTSDIDVSLEIDNAQSISELANKRAFLQVLEQQFSSNQYDVHSFINAQVPGFQVRKQSVFNKNLTVKIDFTVCNEVGIAKTSLLKIYSSLSKRVQQLVCLFKYYVQTKNVSQNKSLSSIAQTNMVVYFLRQNYLPNVQQYFTDEEKHNYLLHHQIDEMHIKHILMKQGYLNKINQTPLFHLFKQLISYYNSILQKSRLTQIISLLDPPATIDHEDYENYPFIIKEYYDVYHNIQPNSLFDFTYFALVLQKTDNFLQSYNKCTQSSELINQIFNLNTQYNIDQMNKQELIDEFNLDINSSFEN